jgi:Transposase DDE domain
LASGIKGNEQGKGRGNKISLSEFLDIAARHHIHVYLLLPYRQLEGFLKVMSAHIQELREVPDYTTMWWWRVVRVKVQEELNSEVNPQKVEDVITTIAVDSTGIKVTNRGEWIRDKWKKRRGFIKIHVAVNVRTKKIVSMEVTKEDVVDGKMLKPLTRQAVGGAKYIFFFFFFFMYDNKQGGRRRCL